MRLGYPPEHVASLIGEKYAPLYEAWMASSIEGDRIGVRLASRARDEDPVRVQQIIKGLEVAMGTLDPLTQLPMVKPDRLIEELFRALALGEPDKYSAEEIAGMMAAQQAQSMMNEEGGGKQNGSSRSSGERGGAPQRGQQNGKARALPV